VGIAIALLIVNRLGWKDPFMINAALRIGMLPLLAGKKSQEIPSKSRVKEASSPRQHMKHYRADTFSFHRHALHPVDHVIKHACCAVSSLITRKSVWSPRGQFGAGKPLRDGVFRIGRLIIFFTSTSIQFHLNTPKTNM